MQTHKQKASNKNILTSPQNS